MCARTVATGQAACGSSPSARTAICGASTPAARSSASATPTATASFRPARSSTGRRPAATARTCTSTRRAASSTRAPRPACVAGRGRTRPTRAAPAQDVLTGQPSSGGHRKHTVHVWDGWMYVQSGSAGNVISSSTSSYDTGRNLIKRFNIATFSGTAFNWRRAARSSSTGLRNVLGFSARRDGPHVRRAERPGRRHLRRRRRSQRQPGRGRSCGSRPGSHHGYPFCFVAQRVNSIAPGTQVRSRDLPRATRATTPGARTRPTSPGR